MLNLWNNINESLIVWLLPGERSMSIVVIDGKILLFGRESCQLGSSYQFFSHMEW